MRSEAEQVGLQPEGCPPSAVGAPAAHGAPAEGGVVRESLDASAVPAAGLTTLGILRDAGRQSFLVGGFVRDSLLGAPAHDLDVATDALWYQARELFLERGYQVLNTGVRHGTITVLVDGRHIEVTTFRTDGTYSDHRRPDSVRFVSNIEDDLARRDFTVNAMAWSPETGLIDPFGGRRDLEAGVVRAVGDPERRFDEDALRIMRAVRFSSKLGFLIDGETSEAVHRLVRNLAHVARERVATEYDGIVCGRGAVQALRSYPDVVAEAVPPIADMVGFDQLSRWHCHDVWEHCLHALEALDGSASRLLRHVTLLHDIGKPGSFTLGKDGHGHFYRHEELGAQMLRSALENLRWRKSDVDYACCLVRFHDHRIDPSPRGVLRMLHKIASSFPGAEAVAQDVFSDLLALKHADAVAHAPSSVPQRLRELAAVERTFSQIVAENKAFRLNDLLIDGRDVMAAGFSAGPVVGSVLRSALRAVIDGEVPNERHALLAYVAALGGSGGSGVSARPQSRDS